MLPCARSGAANTGSLSGRVAGGTLSRRRESSNLPRYRRGLGAYRQRRRVPANRVSQRSRRPPALRSRLSRRSALLGGDGVERGLLRRSRDEEGEGAAASHTMSRPDRAVSQGGTSRRPPSRRVRRIRRNNADARQPHFSSQRGGISHDTGSGSGANHTRATRCWRSALHRESVQGREVVVRTSKGFVGSGRESISSDGTFRKRSGFVSRTSN